MIKVESPQHAIEIVNQTLVAEFELAPEDISATARMREDLGLDSLDAVDLVVALEKTFGVQIPEETARQMRLVGDIYKYIELTAIAERRTA